MAQKPLTDMRAPAAEAAKEESGTRMSPVLIIGIVVILLIVGAWLIVSQRNVTTVTYDDAGNPITHVVAGYVVDTFPAYLLLENGVTVQESYKIGYEGDGNTLSTVRYQSALSLEDNINLYGEYLLANEWTITVEPDYEATDATNFYAIKGNEHANITFAPHDAGVTVIISHLLQG